MDSSIKNKKAKLPRKRKKRAIKSQGRKWYHDTILLHNITANSVCEERVCKFWVNSSIVTKIKVLPDGTPLPFYYPTKFW